MIMCKKILMFQIFFLLLNLGFIKAQDNFIKPFKVGNYYEYEYAESNIATRFWAKVTKDTLINGLVYQKFSVYNEPARGNYSIFFYWDMLL